MSAKIHTIKIDNAAGIVKFYRRNGHTSTRRLDGISSPSSVRLFKALASCEYTKFDKAARTMTASYPATGE